MKNTKIILYILLLLIICGIVFFIFKVEIKNEKTEVDNVSLVDKNAILPTPDRIIYKNANNEYKVVIGSSANKYSQADNYEQIYTELYNTITNAIEGKVYSEDEICQIQSKGSFVEFDYNTKSKNFVFMLDEDEIGIIKRLSEGGQVIQTSIPNKDKLKNSMDNLTKEIPVKYDYNTEYNYNSENRLSEIARELSTLSTKVVGVYQKIITDNENEYNDILTKLNFRTNQEMHKVDFDKESVVITISHYEIENIQKNIGNIKYKLGEFLGDYVVNVFIVSKIVNTNCIYFDTEEAEETNVSTIVEDNNENGVGYYVQNGKCYANINNQKMEILSIERAADIAVEEAKKEKYQYQGWKSDFYAKEGEDDTVSGELITGLDEISKLYLWRKDWQLQEYEGRTMWKIRLFDRNDSLTSLYIYVDAINGDIIGAGDSSD